jgi:hypothetical protein
VVDGTAPACQTEGAGRIRRPAAGAFHRPRTLRTTGETMRLKPLWALLVAAPLAAAAPAPDSYALKLKRDPEPGKSTVVKNSDKATGTLKILDADGKTIQDVRVSEEKEEVYTKTVLEAGDKQPKKFKKTFEKAVRTAEGKTTAQPYQGRTVVYSLKDGKYEASAEGPPELEKHVLAELARGENTGSADAYDLVIPKKPVAVGDKWPISGKDVAKSFAAANEMTLDPDQTKGDAKLTKAYVKGGKQFGVIEVALKLAITGNGGVTFNPPGTMDTKMTLDVAIDGSTTAGTLTLAGKIEGKGTLKQGEQMVTTEFHIDVTGRKEQSAEQ